VALRRITEGDEWKTAFHIGYGLLEHWYTTSSEDIAVLPAKIQSIEN
jgi:hypothetical protein